MFCECLVIEHLLILPDYLHVTKEGEDREGVAGESLREPGELIGRRHKRKECQRSTRSVRVRGPPGKSRDTGTAVNCGFGNWNVPVPASLWEQCQVCVGQTGELRRWRQ